MEETAHSIPTPESLPTTEPEKKSEYSGLGIVVAILLFIAILIFSQYLISDLTNTFAGEKPIMNYNNNGAYNATAYESAQKAYDLSLVPYEGQTLMINAIITIPLFMISLILLYSKIGQKSSFKLTFFALFAAAFVNILFLLTKLANYIYRLDPKLAVYGISIILIILFIACIWFVQEKYHKKSDPLHSKV